MVFAFAGDSSFEGLAGAVTANPNGLLSGIAPLLSGADVTLVNLETALGTKGTKMPKAFNSPSSNASPPSRARHSAEPIKPTGAARS